MSEESLSALLDGECSAQEVRELLDAGAGSAALRQRWSRMCIARDALQGVTVGKGADDFCAGVMAALEAEMPAMPVARVIALPRRPRRSGLRWQPAVGLAAAASVAAVVVVGARSWWELPARPADQAVVMTQAAPVAAVASAGVSPALNVPALNAPSATQGALVQVVNAAGSTSADVAPARLTEPAELAWGQIEPATEQQLNEMLIEHSSMRAGQGMGASLNYARMAVHTVEYRPAEQR